MAGGSARKKKGYAAIEKTSFGIGYNARGGVY
jgi:hypothetical protein